MQKFLFLKSLMTALALGGGVAMAQPSGSSAPGGFLTPEQRAMLLEDAHTQTQNMTDDQRRAWRRDQFRKLAAMPDAERAKFKAGLQAKWDALPQADKDQIEQRLAARQTARAQSRARPPAPDMNPNQGQAVAQ